MLSAVTSWLSRTPPANGIAVLLPIAITTSACGLLGSPVHVRDEAVMFSADARAEAEDRLREVASQRGVLVFVVTDPDEDADPPRMLDAPMADAEARGLPAVAVLVGPNGIVGIGHSAGMESTFDAPSATYRLLEDGRPDEALSVRKPHPPLMR